MMALQFREQIEFFRAKRNVLTEHWLDVPLEELDAVFTVPGIESMELLAAVRSFVDSVIANGDTVREFIRGARGVAAQHDWGAADDDDRLRDIYNLHLRQSYNAGRWQQLQALRRVRLYWMYVVEPSRDCQVLGHQAWDQLVLQADDPWWHTYFPMNGFGCHCRVQAINERDMKRLGVKRGVAPPIEWRTLQVNGRTVRTPEGIYPGFAYAPGRRYWESLNNS